MAKNQSTTESTDSGTDTPEEKIQFYSGGSTGEVYVIRHDAEFAAKMLTQTVLLTAVPSS